MGDFDRTVIIGNSGSGKSWLAARLSALLGIPATDLDTIHWEPGGYGVQRDRQLAVRDVLALAQSEAWIIEGVYGWLAEIAVPRATLLLWLDLPIDECLVNLRGRGLRGGGDEESFIGLLKWAGEYRTRTNSNSWTGHSRIFEAFSGRKVILSSRPEITDFLAEAAERYPPSSSPGSAG
jgi:hypothetical protein